MVEDGEVGSFCFLIEEGVLDDSIVIGVVVSFLVDCVVWVVM